LGGQERSRPQSPDVRKKENGAIIIKSAVYIVYKKSVVFSYSLLNMYLVRRDSCLREKRCDSPECPELVLFLTRMNKPFLGHMGELSG